MIIFLTILGCLVLFAGFFGFILIIHSFIASVVANNDEWIEDPDFCYFCQIRTDIKHPTDGKIKILDDQVVYDGRFTQFILRHFLDTEGNHKT